MSKEKSDVKVSLVLLRDLMASLEQTVFSAERHLESKDETSINQYVVELSKAMGVASGLVTEATLLIGDMKAAVKHNSAPTGAKFDDLADLLGSALKGSGPGSN